MPTDRDLLQQALPKIVDCAVFEEERTGLEAAKETWALYHTIRTRLAQPEPEPINYEDWKFNPMTGKPLWDAQPEPEPVRTFICPTCKADRFKEDCKGDRMRCGTMGKAYTAPPRKEWQGLTEMEVMDICNFSKGQNAWFYVREVESKLKEKNGG